MRGWQNRVRNFKIIWVYSCHNIYRALIFYFAVYCCSIAIDGNMLQLRSVSIDPQIQSVLSKPHFRTQASASVMTEREVRQTKRISMYLLVYPRLQAPKSSSCRNFSSYYVSSKWPGKLNSFQTQQSKKWYQI